MKYTMTSPESIRHWSFGKVKYRIINIKTKEPWHGGLFCARIFDQQKIMNVFAENIEALNTEASFVRNAVLK